MLRFSPPVQTLATRDPQVRLKCEASRVTAYSVQELMQSRLEVLNFGLNPNPDRTGPQVRVRRRVFTLNLFTSVTERDWRSGASSLLGLYRDVALSLA